MTSPPSHQRGNISVSHPWKAGFRSFTLQSSETLDSSVARGLDWLYEDARFDPRGDKKLLQDLDGKSAPCKPRCGNRRAAGRGPDHAVFTPPGDVQSQAKQATPRACNPNVLPTTLNDLE
ncbi:hypothetical protein RRG08_058327 [Elysia crispata]|uniref:Uncharacterized protein n=1 Tax=Elysia crispata TaxID=231223 RepID=A0AAE0ZBQ4_9GAST|nr:hypothetical protein RRG08_058327 [Elysia crispata]